MSWNTGGRKEAREKTKKRRKEERGKESGIIQNHCGGLENELRIAWGEGWGEGIVMEFGVVLYTLIYLKWIINKDLLYSTGNSAQCYVAA